MLGLPCAKDAIETSNFSKPVRFRYETQMNIIYRINDHYWISNDPKKYCEYGGSATYFHKTFINVYF